MYLFIQFRRRLGILFMVILFVAVVVVAVVVVRACDHLIHYYYYRERVSISLCTLSSIPWDLFYKCIKGQSINVKEKCSNRKATRPVLKQPHNCRKFYYTECAVTATADRLRRRRRRCLFTQLVALEASG